MRDVLVAQGATILRALDTVFLHQHPAVAAIAQRLDEGKGDVGLVGQRHLRRREATHARQGVEAEDRGEVLLEGLDVQAVVLDRRRRRHRVSPGGAQPFHAAGVVGLARQRHQRREHVVESHVA